MGIKLGIVAATLATLSMNLQGVDDSSSVCKISDQLSPVEYTSSLIDCMKPRLEYPTLVQVYSIKASIDSPYTNSTIKTFFTVGSKSKAVPSLISSMSDQIRDILKGDIVKLNVENVSLLYGDRNPGIVDLMNQGIKTLIFIPVVHQNILYGVVVVGWSEEEQLNRRIVVQLDSLAVSMIPNLVRESILR